MKWRIAQVRRIHRMNALAPASALVVLLAIAAIQGGGGANVDRFEAEKRVTEVGARVAAIPYRMGDWVGRDVELPAAALEILHSAAVVSRDYANLRTGEHARLAIVFCGDVRDMLGHHPPACYPASGWTSTRLQGDPSAGGALPISLHGVTVDANVFRFEKPDSVGGDQRITIIGFFTLPGVGMTPDANVVRSRATRRAISARGAGQVQVLLDGFPSIEAARAIAGDLLKSIPPSTFEMLTGDPADERIGGSGNAIRTGGVAGDFRHDAVDDIETRVSEDVEESSRQTGQEPKRVTRLAEDEAGGET